MYKCKFSLKLGEKELLQVALWSFLMLNTLFAYLSYLSDCKSLELFIVEDPKQLSGRQLWITKLCWWCVSSHLHARLKLSTSVYKARQPHICHPFPWKTTMKFIQRPVNRKRIFRPCMFLSLFPLLTCSLEQRHIECYMVKYVM